MAPTSETHIGLLWVLTDSDDGMRTLVNALVPFLQSNGCTVAAPECATYS